MLVSQSKLTKSVLSTLAYSDHFSFPLTSKEIYKRLINVSFAKDRSELPKQFRSLSGLQQTLKELISKLHIQKTGSYYHLPGRSHLVELRKNRSKLSTTQLARAKTLTCHLSLVPYISAIYLTGSLAMHNSDGDSDIDLMIITKTNRLWLTRFILTIYTELLGLRRRPFAKHTKDKICLNLYLTPNAYALPECKRSLYTAYELIQAVPLYDPRCTRIDLLAANPWISNYLPNAISRSDLEGRAQPEQSGERSDLLGYIEKFAFWLQKTYMQKKITHEYITIDSAYFHPNNPAPKLP